MYDLWTTFLRKGFDWFKSIRWTALNKKKIFARKKKKKIIKKLRVAISWVA
jgi:hypothetical protein